MRAKGLQSRSVTEQSRTSGQPPRATANLDLPKGLRAPFETLANANIHGWLEGESLHDWLCGDPPRWFGATVRASYEDILTLFPSAVPTSTSAGIASLPTPAGPLDLRASAKLTDPEAELSQRPFSVLALGLEPLSMRWIDPLGGLADLERRRLRASPHCNRWQAIWGLIAARLIAGYGYRADRDVETRSEEHASEILDTPALKRRTELRRILLSPDAGEGLRFLKKTGLEAQLLPGAAGDSSARVDRLSNRLELRMAGWLQKANARAFLRNNGFGSEFARGIYLRLEHHPIEASVSHRNDGALRRLMRRLSEEELGDLIELRQVDAAQARPAEGITIRRELEHFQGALERIRRQQAEEHKRGRLALDGRAIMQILDCGPGPEVGQAVRALRQFVDEDPRHNDPEALRAHLIVWRNATCRNS